MPSAGREQAVAHRRQARPGPSCGVHQQGQRVHDAQGVGQKWHVHQGVCIERRDEDELQGGTAQHYKARRQPCGRPRPLEPCTGASFQRNGV